MTEKLSTPQNHQNNTLKIDYEDKAVRGTPGPVEKQGVEAVYEKFSDDPYARKILGYAQYGIDGFDSGAVRLDDFKTFYEGHSAPQDFLEIDNEILRLAHNKYTGDGYQAYVDALANFKDTVYGEKQKKWDELMAKREAEARAAAEFRNLPLAKRLRIRGSKTLSAAKEAISDLLQSPDQTPPHPHAA